MAKPSRPAVVSFASFDNGSQQLPHRTCEAVGEPAAGEGERSNGPFSFQLQFINPQYRTACHAPRAVDHEGVASRLSWRTADTSNGDG